MKRVIAFIFLLFSVTVFAQRDTGMHQGPGPYAHKGILAGVGTVGVGEMPAYNISNVYVTGNLEYYAQSNVSIRGDGYFFVNSLTQNSPLKQNSAIYFGAYYHFPVYGSVGQYFDPLIGFQPGAAFARTSDTLHGKSDAGAIAPLLSFVIGFNYFAEKWFHIQANIRFTSGQESTQESQFNLTEVSFNFGLGWNLDMISQKKQAEYRQTGRFL